MMKNIIIIIISFVAVFVFAGLMSKIGAPENQPDQKVYVAAEGDGSITVVDPSAKKVIKKIDLSAKQDGQTIKFAAHNVQVSPDGKSVWVTANAGAHSHGSIGINVAYAHEGGGSDLAVDQLIVIDPVKDAIKARILIAEDIGLGHVVVAPNNRFVYATAQEEGVVYKIDAQTYEIIKEISAGGKGSQPHGLRISPDGRYAYIAMLGSRALGVLELRSDTFSQIPVEGQAVQAGITPDGKLAMVSLYDKKSLAVYDIAERTIREIKLPEGARGPIQMFPTPDSRYVYMADQGYYFGQPSSRKVYKLDLRQMSVAKSIEAGEAPHGVVVSKDGKFVYVTNLLSNDLSIIDTASNAEVSRIKVGKEPNGVSVWYK